MKMKRVLRRIHRFIFPIYRKITGIKRTAKYVCTKDNPFVPPLKDKEYWMHKDAYDKFPDHEFSTVVFYCPNCKIDISLDLGD